MTFDSIGDGDSVLTQPEHAVLASWASLAWRNAGQGASNCPHPTGDGRCAIRNPQR